MSRRAITKTVLQPENQREAQSLLKSTARVLVQSVFAVPWVVSLALRYLHAKVRQEEAKADGAELDNEVKTQAILNVQEGRRIYESSVAPNTAVVASASESHVKHAESDIDTEQDARDDLMATVQEIELQGGQVEIREEPLDIQEQERSREEVYDMLMNARQADWVELTLDNGKTYSGAIIFNEFEGSGRLINVEDGISFDFNVDQVKDVSL